MLSHDGLVYRIDGHEYRLGRLPRRATVGSIYPVLGEDVGRPGVHLIPRKEWSTIDNRHMVKAILDQDGTRACNAFASVQCLHCIREEAGLPYVELSAGNLYGRINGGADRGSLISDAIQQLEDVGVCKADAVGQLEWQRRRWPAEWKEEATRFRVLEAWDCPTFDHQISAVLLGFFVNTGILVGSRFRPDPDTGWLPDYIGGGGGHAMCACGVARDEKTNRWGLIVANSWGKDWGVDGFGIIPESYYRATPFNDAWAVRGVTDPTGDE